MIPSLWLARRYPWRYRRRYLWREGGTISASRVGDPSIVAAHLPTSLLSAPKAPLTPSSSPGQEPSACGRGHQRASKKRRWGTPLSSARELIESDFATAIFYRNAGSIVIPFDTAAYQDRSDRHSLQPSGSRIARRRFPSYLALTPLAQRADDRRLPGQGLDPKLDPALTATSPAGSAETDELSGRASASRSSARA